MNIEDKVKSQAEIAKMKIDEQCLTGMQIADLMVLLAKDLKKEVKDSKKVKKVNGTDEKVKKPLNEGLKAWHAYTHYLQVKVLELRPTDKVMLRDMIRLGSLLKTEGYYPEGNLSDEVLLNKYDEWSMLSKELKFPAKEAKVKGERKVRAKKVVEVKVEEVKDDKSKPKPKSKTKKEEVVVRPEEGVFFAQMIKGIKYLTCSYDGDELLYVYNESEEYVGAYSFKSCEIEQSVSDPTI